MRPKSLYISGTDTDVGKSVVTACIGAAWRGRVTAIKPVASGVTDEHGDAELIAYGAGHAPHVFQTWATPVSPHRAAELENTPLDVGAMLAWLDHFEGHRIVEGVGGWRVPLSLSPRFDTSDLGLHLDLPVVIVAANRLGVLNHTLLTIEAIRAAGLPVAGVVLNDFTEDDPSVTHNLTDLRRLLATPVVQLHRLHSLDLQELTVAGHHILQHLF